MIKPVLRKLAVKIPYLKDVINQRDILKVERDDLLSQLAMLAIRDSGNMLNGYIRKIPSAQNAVDIFEGEWSSKFPDEFGERAGDASLFADERIKIGVEKLGGIGGQRVRELGPLEAGQTYMLEQLGAAEIVAIEANSHTYLKCLITKELTCLRKARFLLGDFVEYLRHTCETFDLILASGVLYHMSNPVELISLISRRADRFYFGHTTTTGIYWT